MANGDDQRIGLQRQRPLDPGGAPPARERVPTGAHRTMTDDGARQVRITRNGPLMIQGPVRIETPDGDTVDSDRFMVAICTCRRSKSYPLCDTSHRSRGRRVRDSDQRSTQ